MKIKIITLFLAFSCSSTYAHTHYPVHILPDQPIEGDALDLVTAQASNIFASDHVKASLDAGKRNMDWLAYMNSFKKEGEKIQLTKPGELQSYPIDQPNIYSPDTIRESYKEISETIPESMRKVIFQRGRFPKEPTEDLETYIFWAKKVDKLYQSAARWTLIKPHLNWYKHYKAADIRGYYYLNKDENVEQNLENFSSLPEQTQSEYAKHLVNLCENKEGVFGCEKKFAAAVEENTILDFFFHYYPTGKKVFDSNFLIEAKRSDLVWTSAEPNRATIPVRDSKNSEINHFLEFNTEDEWKWGDWQLDLLLTPNADIYLRFVAGVTPNVNTLAGNRITMDANAPLTEWNTQWTIRHEFGHVLGLPDCYVEFYDGNLKAMVNYQIDTENLMCSRAGKMQEIHYNELKRAYFKQ